MKFTNPIFAFAAICLLLSANCFFQDKKPADKNLAPANSTGQPEKQKKNHTHVKPPTKPNGNVQAKKPANRKQDVEIYDETASSTIVDSYPVEYSTLVEFPIDYERSITYYYPYFYKTHIITFADEIDTTVLATNCLDFNCAYCDQVFTEHCFRCNTGFYLNGQSCALDCPEGYTLDTLRGKCVTNQQVVSAEVIYTKSYTVGSCKNACGRKQSDCSCDPSCKQNGTCCSDYETASCDRILSLNSSRCRNLTNSTCEYCDETNLTNNSTAQDVVCLQCSASSLFHRGQCVSSCPVNHTAAENNICKKDPTCDVQGCAECDRLNPGQCSVCQRGKFLFNGNCVDSCPSGYRADRISWNCLEVPVFAWYWVYPSRTSCRTHCGVVIQEDWDCSCSDSCFYYGNCCMDIEDYCPDLLFWRKAPKNRKANRTEPNNKKSNLKKENIKVVRKHEKKNPQNTTLNETKASF